MSPLVEYSILLTSLNHKQLVTYFDVANAALFLYDFCLTIGDEYALIWPAQWHLGKILYLLTRYLPFIDMPIVLYHGLSPHISVAACSLAYKSTGWLFAFGIGVAEIILILRTSAVWSNDRRVIFGLSIFFIAIWTPICVLMALFLDSLTFAPHPIPGVSGCFLTGASAIIFGGFILLMAFETSILILTLWKGVHLVNHGNASHLISTLYQDGIMYYIYLFGIAVINVVVLLNAARDYATILSSTQRVMHSLLTTRVLLHLRGASTRSKQNTIASLSTLDIC